MNGLLFAFWLGGFVVTLLSAWVQWLESDHTLYSSLLEQSPVLTLLSTAVFFIAWPVLWPASIAFVRQRQAEKDS